MEGKTYTTICRENIVLESLVKTYFPRWSANDQWLGAACVQVHAVKALSLWLKCWSYFAPSTSVSCDWKTIRRVPMCFLLLPPRSLTAPYSCLMSLFRTVCACSGAIPVLVRQLGKTTELFFSSSGPFLARHPSQLISLQNKSNTYPRGEKC